MLSAEQYLRDAVVLANTTAFVKAGNPRVGCVIADSTGAVIGTGAHLGSGSAHAEVVALKQAGTQSRGAHVFVTLEPCSHAGRTPPCTEALIAAGVSSVTYAVPDPGDHSGGGAQMLQEHGLDVHRTPHEAAEDLVRDWLHVQRTGRPYIIGKCAMSLDGRVAQSSGAPWPLTGAQTNRDAHVLRASVDAIVVGTGTVILDDPVLTARTDAGELHPQQPKVFVVGERAVPGQARVHEQGIHHIQSRDVHAAIGELINHGVAAVLLEGGPTLLGAWVAAGVVDELRWSISPVIMGSGPRAASGLKSASVTVNAQGAEMMEEDVVIRAHPTTRE